MVFTGIGKFLGINGVPNQSNQDNSVQQDLLSGMPFRNNIHERNRDAGFRRKIAKCFGDCLPGAKFLIDVRAGEQEKVHLWLSTMARTESSLVLEYVHSTERGLSFKEAEERLKEAGPNNPVENLLSSRWQIFLTALWHPFNIVLVVLAALCFVANDKANGSILVVMVTISVSVRFYQEFRSSVAALKLSELVKVSIKVQRCAGRDVQTELQVQIEKKDVVPGDIIIFNAGDIFPGDVSQSSLTGESGTVEKFADVIEETTTPLLELRNICFMGTSVVSGSGTGVVVSTGDKTYLSTILSTLGRRSPPHAFEKGVKGVSYVLICFMLAVVPIISMVAYFTKRNLVRSIVFGISAAVGLTPHMLPLIVNTNLAKGALAMAREKCIVKRLVAIQNMGVMDILCTDKTGTLTMDRLVVVHHLDCWGMSSDKILYFAFLNSYFQNGSTNPLDDAILAYSYTGGYRFQPTKWIKINEVPFDFSRRRTSVVLEESNDDQVSRKKHVSHMERIMVLKGAYQEVLEVCSFVQNDINKDIIEPLSSEDYQRLVNMAEELSNDGLRVIGVATRKLKPAILQNGCNDTAEENMVFIGYLAFFDPPKESVKEALWHLAEKGVKVKVLTGDTLTVAINVCKEVGICTTNVITGPELALLEDESFHDVVRKVTVLAKLTPIQKLQVVESLKMGKHIVGFLGDGLNDSLALKGADVGISVDSGTSVAKDLAQIILLEKDLNVLVAGVECGRITHGNSMKYIQMAVAANLGTVVSMIVACACLPFDPLTPVLLLAQTLLYDLSQIFIPWDKMDPEYVKIPHHWSASDIVTFMLWNGPTSSIFDIVTFLFLCQYYDANTRPKQNFFHSAWFVEGLLMQTLIIHMMRTEKIPFIQSRASWPVTCATVIISAIGIALPYSVIGKIMGMENLPFSYFGFLVIAILGYFFVGQLVKMAYIYVFKRWL
ncbi:uncharacterized protein LOC131031261 isoform X2 [Cryptomeria japonica]|uniref:uncharacterized protein LOC131031261 isoform X2 n=1 Tax=Cryptomeria japonica TaxID=3369 RepID=UPI0027DA23D6|nr:uncharacterized protein LOC131031261 isoform X2 [Cryptomeria japonica]